MIYIHLFLSDENEKFTKAFYNLLKNDFIISEHLILIPKHSNENLQLVGDNIKYFNYDFKWMFLFLKSTLSCKKIILHGLPNNIYFYILFIIFPNLAKKSVWIIWGGDLYYYKLRSQNFKSNISEFFRRKIIQNIKYFVTYLNNDYLLVQKWYKTRGVHLNSFVYPSNLYKEININSFIKNDKILILIGNSACKTNNHLELFKKLEFLNNENIIFYCPLSYSGTEEYKKQIIEIGYQIFGNDKFIPLLDFIPIDEYNKFLCKIDVAIFNHDRQRGLGNIITLLGLGKKVFINECISTWNYCHDNNLKVYSINSELKEILTPFPKKLLLSNVRKIKHLFSLENLIKDLNIIFN
jgi:dTDP-N-acetylfucosamine:lipid II N-acetylfucosaminyltransferase